MFSYQVMKSRGPDMPMVVAGNKTDVDGALEREQTEALVIMMMMTIIIIHGDDNGDHGDDAKLVYYSFLFSVIMKKKKQCLYSYLVPKTLFAHLDIEEQSSVQPGNETLCEVVPSEGIALIPSSSSSSSSSIFQF